MRIISLLPAATDIVVALGASHLLAGVTHECDAPGALHAARVTRSSIDVHLAPRAVDAGVRAAVEADAPLFALDDALIESLEPDVILTQAICDVCAVSEGDVRALAARMTRNPEVVTLGGTTIDGVFADVDRVATAIGQRDRGAVLLAAMHERISCVHATLKAARAPRPRVAVIEWTDPIFVAGHWVPEMVARAGGTDMMAKAGAHSVVVDAAQVARAAPEVVIVAPCGYDIERAAAEAMRLRELPEWAWLATRALWAIDGSTLTSRPGPSIVDGIEVMAAIFHPSLFAAPEPIHARDVTRR